jgi:hypothetical protein
MVLNIIHLPHRTDRLKLLEQELVEQNISQFQIWDGVVHESNPQKGISQAHKQIVKYAKEANLSEVLIAEDDLHFTSKGAFDYFIKSKPVDYDIFLGGILDGVVNVDNTIDDFSGTTLYIVNSQFYDVFLSVPENINIDRALRHRGKFIVCNPLVATQHNGFSDNIRQFCVYDLNLGGRIYFGNA